MDKVLQTLNEGDFFSLIIITFITCGAAGLVNKNHNREVISGIVGWVAFIYYCFYRFPQVPSAVDEWIFVIFRSYIVLGNVAACSMIVLFILQSIIGFLPKLKQKPVYLPEPYIPCPLPPSQPTKKEKKQTKEELTKTTI